MKLLSRRKFIKEYYVWGILSVLSTVQVFTELTPWIISLAFVGKISSVQLAALSLVEVWVYSFLEVGIRAVTEASSVLISQAHGASNLDAQRGWLAMSMIITTVMAALVSIASLCTTYALDSFISDADLVREGSLYAMWISPAIFFTSYESCLATYFIATGHAGYSTISSLLFCFLDISLMYLFMFGGLGMKPFSSALYANAVSWNIGGFLILCLNLVFLYWILCDEKIGSDKARKYYAEIAMTSVHGGRRNVLSIASYQHQTTIETEDCRTPPSAEGTNDELKDEEAQHRISMQNGFDNANQEEDKARKNGSRTLGNFGDERSKLFQREDTMSSLSGGEDEDGEDKQNDSLRSPGRVPRGSRRNRSGRSSRSSSIGSRASAMDYAQLSDHTVYDWLTSCASWKTFGNLLCPVLMTAAMENLIYLILAMFVAQRLGRNPMAAHNVCTAMLEYAFSTIVGMAEATSVRIGYYVGRDDLVGTHTVTVIAFANSLFLGVLTAVLAYYFSEDIVQWFTKDSEIIQYILQVFPLLCASFAVFAVGDQMLAILEGQGRANVQMIASFIGLWTVTVPLAYFWLYDAEYAVSTESPTPANVDALKSGLRAIWWALLMGYVVCDLIATGAVYHSDYPSIFARAHEHMTLG